jgi:hypothetical protein
MTQKKPIRIVEYAQFIRDNQDTINLCFNLDVIGDGELSYRNWCFLKRRGIAAIPVYHIGTDEKFLKLYMKETDYIAVGAISNISTVKRLESMDRVWTDYLVDSQGMPKLKVHGFGLTSIVIMRRYPFFSVDSTSWVQFSRYGIVLVPQRQNASTYVYDENPYKVNVSSRSPRKADAGEHITTFAKGTKIEILRYFRENGFRLGHSEFDAEEKETKVREGLCNNHLQRDLINMLYYLRVGETMQPWPWAFTATNNHARMF